MSKLHLTERQLGVFKTLLGENKSIKATVINTHVGESTLEFGGEISLTVGSLGLKSHTKITINADLSYETNSAVNQPVQTAKSGCAKEFGGPVRSTKR